MNGAARGGVRRVEQGTLPRLVVSEHGRQLGKVVIEIRIEGRR